MGHRVEFKPAEGKVTATRSLRESGGSTVLTIPPEIIDVMGWSSQDDLILDADYENGELIIKKSENQAV